MALQQFCAAVCEVPPCQWGKILENDLGRMTVGSGKEGELIRWVVFLVRAMSL